MVEVTDMKVTMNDDEIDYFESFFAKKKSPVKMVEWGSGGSTKMFLDKPNVGTLVSIEHNADWHTRVTEALKDHPKRKSLDYLFIPPELALSFYGYGIPQEENPTFNTEYINPNLAFQDLDIWDADVYLIDGISRGACLATTHIKAKNRDAAVFIHDYVGREQWYDWAVGLYSVKKIVGSTLVQLAF